MYDPSNPYDDNGSSGGYVDPFGGYGDGWWNNPWYVDPSNPYDGFYDPNRVGPIVPADSPTQIYGPGAATGDGFGLGHGSLGPNNPTQYPGSQWPNIGIGIPGLIGIGAGGIMTGGLLGGGGGGSQPPNTNQTNNNILLGGGSPESIMGPDEFPAVNEGPNTGQHTIYAPLGSIGGMSQIPQPTQTGPSEGGGGGTIMLPPVVVNPSGPSPTGPSDNPSPNTIYSPLGPGLGLTPTVTTPPGGGGGGGGGNNPPPAQTPTPNTPINVTNRNYLQEGQLGYQAMQQLMPQLLGQYGQYSGQPGQADAANFKNLLFGQYGAGAYNPELTRLANEQTMASNTALRYSNVGDVGALAGQASAQQRAVNPELYGMLGAYSGGAQQQLGADYAAVGRGGQLSPEEIRMAQQSAREAAGAQGRLRGNGTQAAEVLNRFQYQQQRDQVNRANLGQSQQAALGGMGAAQAAAFNPYNTLLGQGMNTQNVGTNQSLFGQQAAFSSGGLSNQYVQQLGNPYNPYAADVYGSNFNAENARAIAGSNNSAAAKAAEEALLGKALGSLFQTGVQTGWKFGF